MYNKKSGMFSPLLTLKKHRQSTGWQTWFNILYRFEILVEGTFTKYLPNSSEITFYFLYIEVQLVLILMVSWRTVAYFFSYFHTDLKWPPNKYTFRAYNYTCSYIWARVLSTDIDFKGADIWVSGPSGSSFIPM